MSKKASKGKQVSEKGGPDWKAVAEGNVIFISDLYPVNFNLSLIIFYEAFLNAHTV